MVLEESPQAVWTCRARLGRSTVLEYDAVSHTHRVTKVLVAPADLEAGVRAIIRLSRQRLHRPYLSEILGYTRPGQTDVILHSEFFPRGSLRQCMRRFDETDAAAILRQLLNAARLLHANSLVHTSIRPECIFVASFNPLSVKLGGLESIARPIDEQRSITPYSAPDLFLEEGYTSAADIWSIGTVTYELLAGRLLFRDIDEMQEYLDGAQLPHLDASQPVVSFVRTVTMCDPDERPTAEEALSAAWLQEIPPLRAEAAPVLPLPPLPSKSLSRPVSTRANTYNSNSDILDEPDDIVDFAQSLAETLHVEIPPKSPLRSSNNEQRISQAMSLASVIDEPEMVMPPTQDSCRPQVLSPTDSGISLRSEHDFGIEAINRKVEDGEWITGDSVVSCKVVRWDLVRIAAYKIKSTSPLVFTELTHKPYIEELPSKIFASIKPWMQEQLESSAVLKSLSKPAFYVNQIRAEILPFLKLDRSSQREYQVLALPATQDVVETTQEHIQDDLIQIPTRFFVDAISDHWRLYIEEYIKGFMLDSRVAKGNIKAVVFDEPWETFTRHREDLYDQGLRAKIGPKTQFCNVDGFKEWAEKSKQNKKRWKSKR